jgi:hypothetical protein
LYEPFSTGANWLLRAVVMSALLHGVIVAVWYVGVHKSSNAREVQLVDIELAPPPPKAEALTAEVARPPQASPGAAAASSTETPELPTTEPMDVALVDAGVPDAPPPDAAPKKKKRPDAGVVDDAGVDEDAGVEDAGVDDAGVEEPHLASGVADAGSVAMMTDLEASAALHDGGVGSAAVAVAVAVGSGAGSSETPGVAAATNVGSGSGTPGTDNLPAVDGAPTTAGTAANLLAYFPAGHQITALIRFDRLRSTEWAEPAEKLFKPMPDYRALFGDRVAGVGDKLDTLIISTPRPRDAAATTLVVHSQLTRPQLRAFLTNRDTPIAWSATKGGLLGKRSGKLFQGDKRVLLSPWKNWVVLAQPEDLGGVTAPAGGSLDAIEAKAKLPPWLDGIRTIETESGDEKQRGPALVLTLVGSGKRYKIPDVGLGITSAPSPVRLSLAMELTKQGWLVRGNIVFANEADATEFVTTVEQVKERVTDSRLLSGLLRKQHAYNAVAGLSVARGGARVSYATSLSIADARAVMVVMAQTLEDYFAPPTAAPAPAPGRSPAPSPAPAPAPSPVP